jgi:hypothetical protein
VFLLSKVLDSWEWVMVKKNESRKGAKTQREFHCFIGGDFEREQPVAGSVVRHRAWRGYVKSLTYMGAFGVDGEIPGDFPSTPGIAGGTFSCRFGVDGTIPEESAVFFGVDG